VYKIHTLLTLLTTFLFLSLVFRIVSGIKEETASPELIFRFKVCFVCLGVTKQLACSLLWSCWLLFRADGFR